MFIDSQHNTTSAASSFIFSRLNAKCFTEAAELQ
jgi:hypothetical protein